MNSTDRERLVEGNFIVDETQKGRPKALCIGGLLYAPSDFEPLTDELPHSALIVNNPVHTGIIPRIGAWQEELLTGYKAIFEKHQCSYLIAHSGGCMHALDVEEQLEASGRISVRGMVFIAPPDLRKDVLSSDTRLEQYGLLDMLLSHLCADLPDELYHPLIEHHKREYAANDALPDRIDKKKLQRIFNLERPNKGSMLELLDRVRSSRVPILSIFGDDDPIGLDGDDFGSNVTTVRLPGRGHFPHISAPHEVKEKIIDWFAQTL